MGLLGPPGPVPSLCRQDPRLLQDRPTGLVPLPHHTHCDPEGGQRALLAALGRQRPRRWRWRWERSPRTHTSIIQLFRRLVIFKMFLSVS